MLPAIVLLLVTSCSPSKPPTREVIFYYEIEIANPAPHADYIKTSLEKSFPEKKYAITNSTGLTPPFYGEFELDESLPVDSLMPPHTFIHRMEMLNKKTPVDGSRLLRITLFPEKVDSYAMEIFLFENGNWKFQAQTGIHTIRSEVADIQSVAQKFQESIIRYSFK